MMPRYGHDMDMSVTGILHRKSEVTLPILKYPDSEHPNSKAPCFAEKKRKKKSEGIIIIRLA